MADSSDPPPESGAPKRQLPDTEIQVAAAALTAIVSAPLGVAVAIGSALRSPRVRAALRGGAVRGLARAIEVGNQVTAVAHRAQDAASEATAPDAMRNATPSSPQAPAP